MDRILQFLLENIIASEIEAKFFYRNGFEIDFVIPEKEGTFEEVEIIPAWKFPLR